MVLPVDIRLGDNEYVVQKQLTEVLEVMTFPVIDATLKILDGLLVLCLALRFIDFVCYSLGSVRAGLQICVMGVGVRICGFKKRLYHRSAGNSSHREFETYVK